MRPATIAYAAIAGALIWYIARKSKFPAAVSSLLSTGIKYLATPTPTESLGASRVGVQPSTLAFIAAREGLRLTAYPDAAGYSIGYGHYLGARPEPQSITKAQADAWLNQDALKAAIAVTQQVRVPLTQNQFDALVSLVYNIGAGAFKDSTLLRLLNDGRHSEAAAEFDRWVYSQGAKLPALVSRRTLEKSLFLA